MKKLTIFILMLTLFISVVSINGNEVHAQKIKWGKITIDDEKAYGKIKINEDTVSYKLKNKKMIKNKKKLKKGKEYPVYNNDYYNVGKKSIELFKIGKNLYVQTSEKAEYDPLTKEIRNKLVGNGTLQGSITWQYNTYIGTRPDTGADVIAFQKWEAQKISITDLVAILNGKEDGSDYGIYYTQVDGFGRYSLPLASGKYTILIRSRKTTRDYKEPISENVEKTMKTYIPDFKSTDLAMYFYNHLVKDVKITKGETYTISKDWGYTYF